MPGRDVECVELRVLVSVRPVVMAGRGRNIPMLDGWIGLLARGTLLFGGSWIPALTSSWSICARSGICWCP